MGENASRRSARLPGIALALARLYADQFFLQTGFTKLLRGFLWGGALLPQLERFASDTPHLWYKAWLVNKDFIVLLLVILIGGAGNTWGIDGWRRRR